MCKCLSDKILKQSGNQAIKQSIITQTIKQSNNQAIENSPHHHFTICHPTDLFNTRNETPIPFTKPHNRISFVNNQHKETEKTPLFKGRDRMGATLKSCWPVKDSSKSLTFEICIHVSFRAEITFYYVKDYATLYYCMNAWMCYFVTLFWLGIVSKFPLLSPCTTLMLE